MKHLLLLIPIFLLTISLAYSQQYEDVVYLKNGSIIHGIIIEQVPNESIKIKTKDANIFVYKMDEIEKMTKEEIKKERVDREATTSNSFESRSSSNYSGFGIRGGVGTDITFSLGFGAGAFYVLAPSPYSSSNWDLGLDFYYADVSEDEVDSEGTIWKANTKVLVFALRSNGLFNYHPKSTGVYFVAGVGLVGANIDWEETYTYGPPHYPYSVERYSADAFSIGNVLNLGVGATFGGGLEARFETPFLIFYSVPGYGNKSASSIAPTFTLSVLYRLP
jgi:hypothetical protein